MPTRVEHPNFNIESYVNQYKGQARILRLVQIGSVSPGLAQRAFRQALTELLSTTNTHTYQMVSETASKLLGSKLPDNLAYDNAFVVNTNRNGTATLHVHENALKKAKQTEDNKNVQKYLELVGDHHASYGNYVDAIAAYEEANAHFRLSDEGFIRVANKLIQASIDADQFSNVSRTCNELRKLRDKKRGAGFSAQATAHFLVAASLLQMRDSSQLPSAAKRFLTVPLDGMRAPATLLSAYDLLNYTCLIGLAYFSREEVNELLLGQKFKKYLELRPVWRTIITDYQNCEFGSVFAKLSMMRLDFQLDKYIGRHIPTLYKTIKNNAVIVYFKAFNVLQIPHLADVFDCKVDDMEQSLVNLIAEDKILARIDSANKVVYARSSSARNAAFQAALNMGDNYANQARNMLLNLSLSEKKFAIAYPKKESKGPSDIMAALSGRA